MRNDKAPFSTRTLFEETGRRRRTLTSVVLFGFLAGCSNGSALHAQVLVEISGLPPTADSLWVIGESDDVKTRIQTFTHFPKQAKHLSVLLPGTTAPLLRIRAVAFSGLNVFPTVRAIGTATFSVGQSAPTSILLKWLRPVIQKTSESASEMSTLLVTFGETSFFRGGELVELWLSDPSEVRNCSGAHFLAPLFRRSGQWQAQFTISTLLLSTSAVQVAYRALDLQFTYQIPLFVWPNRAQYDAPLRVESAQLLRDQSSFPSKQLEDEPDQPGSRSAPISSTVKVVNGRLVRVPYKTATNKTSR
jgi:hypothetical protein